MRNRHFPDKAVDLLEQCVAHAISLGKVQVEMGDAQEVAQRMVGMPLGLDERLSSLENTLVERALLSDEDVHTLVNRLQVTLRGLDLRPTRPNAVLLLTGQVAESSEGLAEAIAGALFGSPDRVIAIDFSRFAHPEDINLLVGAPPGYVGYSESLPIHRLVQIPWSVLRFENIDACHPGIREVVTRALAEGFITDGRGKSIYLSDAVVLLTAHLAQDQQRGLGFAPVEAGINVNLFQQAETFLGPELVSQVDLIAAGVKESEDTQRRWIEKHLLLDLSERYIKQGLKLEWDRSAIDWLVSQQGLQINEREWERFVDGHLSPAIIPYLPKAGEEKVLRLAVRYENERIAVDPLLQG
jgi:ATP-dependent Clp protease ATP-binding subunit ClpC